MARSKHQTPTATDLVDRTFTREGKIYCAIAKGYVFEASRRLVDRQLADGDIGDER